MKLQKWISKALNYFRLYRKFRHKRLIKQAKRVHIKLVEISRESNHEPRIIGYTRKINPFVFEELILSAIEDSNVRIIRNPGTRGMAVSTGFFI